MLPKQIVRVLFNADMTIIVGESEGIVQAGIKFFILLYVLKITYLWKT